jgi:phosphatidylserine decarboxylase
MPRAARHGDKAIDMKILDTLTSVFVPIHPEGHRFILLSFVVMLLLFLLWQPLGWIAAVLTIWCVYFFRDPPRVTPDRPDAVIAPADGVVVAVDKAAPPEDLEIGTDKLTRVCIFMNVFNVHINRAPATGRITRIAYRPGAFVNASLDKASEDNERQAFLMSTFDGRQLVFVQIAGLVARRIVRWVDEGQSVSAGERVGMIRFGSRVDVYLDPEMTPLVAVGQTMIGGETVIANAKPKTRQRASQKRQNAA